MTNDITLAHYVSHYDAVAEQRNPAIMLLSN